MALLTVFNRVFEHILVLPTSRKGNLLSKQTAALSPTEKSRTIWKEKFPEFKPQFGKLAKQLHGKASEFEFVEKCPCYFE